MSAAINTTATVHDLTPGAFRSKLARSASQPTATINADAQTIFSDMADGTLALDYGLTFAGFKYEELQLVHSIVGLLGDGETELAMFDDNLADHLKCTPRTVRRWRAAYVKKSQAVNFGFLVITEGEYVAAEKRFQPTRYRFTDDAKAYVERTVDEARASGNYDHDRRGAIEKAARAHYEDVPQAPPIKRTVKPKRSNNVQIERDFINAKRNLDKGRTALDGLPERARSLFLGSGQGEELRALLLKFQSEVADILQHFPQTTDNEQLNDIPDKMSGIPPLSGIPDEDGEDESAHASEEQTVFVESDAPPESCVRVEEEEARTQDLEAAAVWSGIDERLRKLPAPEPPRVSTVELEIVADEPLDELVIEPDATLDRVEERAGLPHSENTPPDGSPPLELYDEHGNFHLPATARATVRQIEDARRRRHLE